MQRLAISLSRLFLAPIAVLTFRHLVWTSEPVPGSCFRKCRISMFSRDFGPVNRWREVCRSRSTQVLEMFAWIFPSSFMEHIVMKKRPFLSFHKHPLRARKFQSIQGLWHLKCNSWLSNKFPPPMWWNRQPQLLCDWLFRNSHWFYLTSTAFLVISRDEKKKNYYNMAFVSLWTFHRSFILSLEC